MSRPILLPNVRAVLEESVEPKDILISRESGLIEKIAPPNTLTGEKLQKAEGKMVFPGFIDPHVHFRVPGKPEVEDWESGSRAALFAGVTCVMEMPNTNPAVINREAYEIKKEWVKKGSRVHYSLYGGLTASNRDELQSIENIKAIKVYLASTTGDLLIENLESLRSPGPKVFSFHAEKESLIKQNDKKYGPIKTPYDHSRIRNAETAIAATKEVIELQKQSGANFHISHVSTAEEVALLQDTPLSFEVCPHHMFFCEDDYKEWGYFLKCNPPIRSKKEMLALREKLYSGDIPMIATDHAPHLKADKLRSQPLPPSGVASLEGGTHLILNEMAEGRLEPTHVRKMLSTNAAERFALKNRGRILEGVAADLAIVDPDLVWTFQETDIHSKCGWSPFVGRKFRSKVVFSIVAGAVYATNSLREIFQEQEREGHRPMVEEV